MPRSQESFIFCIWIGFILASLGGLRSFLRQLA
uniref:Uncharacterized protein n=1 Tax=Physcomitrium patens TaxID=3218 RepID=A0A2K1JQJ2_PHYPA|nr:hypothetical protein PHYPA_016175 [Physcomitrium patens]